MLDIDMEFRKGILFVRLCGSFSIESCIQLDKKLEQLVSDNNVRFITFNVAGLNYIDIAGINTILKYNSALSRIKGRAIICGVDNRLVKLRLHNSKVVYSLFETTDELGAINYITLGGYL